MCCNNTIPKSSKCEKGRNSKKDPQPAEAEVERPDDDEEADINEKVVQFFEDRRYFYDIAMKVGPTRSLRMQS